MVEVQGDIWTERKPEDYVVITTCGTLRTDGKLVMGRGIAFQAAKRYPWLQQALGDCIELSGLGVVVPHPDARLIAFPVKYEFYQRANLQLILKSTLQLLELAPRLEGGNILLPRPGCSNGKLDWLEVEPMLRHYLTDDRYVVFHL